MRRGLTTQFILLYMRLFVSPWFQSPINQTWHIIATVRFRTFECFQNITIIIREFHTYLHPLKPESTLPSTLP